MGKSGPFARAFLIMLVPVLCLGSYGVLGAGPVPACAGVPAWSLEGCGFWCVGVGDGLVCWGFACFGGSER